jgi:hypothetical protein
MRSARDCINEVVKLGLAPMFKAHGFRKSGFNFWRRSGSVTNYFNVQLSQWNQGAEGQFYLNAGVMFDELLAIRGEPVPSAPKYNDCQFMVRLESLNKALPQFYAVNADTKPEQLAREVASVVESTYVRPLNSVRSAKEFEATGWVTAIPWGFPAQFAYALGNLSEARRLVQLEADNFADRGCTFESVAASIGLTFAHV